MYVHNTQCDRQTLGLDFIFCRYYDPLFTLHTPLTPDEYSTHSKRVLARGLFMSDHTYCVRDKSANDSKEYQQIIQVPSTGTRISTDPVS